MTNNLKFKFGMFSGQQFPVYKAVVQNVIEVAFCPLIPSFPVYISIYIQGDSLDELLVSRSHFQEISFKVLQNILGPEDTQAL